MALTDRTGEVWQETEWDSEWILDPVSFYWSTFIYMQLDYKKKKKLWTFHTTEECSFILSWSGVWKMSQEASQP